MLATDPAWGRIKFRGRADADFARSYDAAGREYRWYPPPALRRARFACDVERVRGRPPASLLRHCRAGSARNFWLRWTVAEVLSKLCAVPVLILLRRHRLRHAAVKSGSIIRLNGNRMLLRTFWLSGSRTAITLGFSLGMRRSTARHTGGTSP